MHRSFVTGIVTTAAALFASFVVASCASAPAATPVPTPLPATATPVGGPIATKPVGSRAVDRADFVASDPALVGTTGRAQVIEFFSFKCKLCQEMRAIIHQAQDEYGDVVDFVYLDLDAPSTKDLQIKLKYNGTPPTVIFIDATGKEHARLTGSYTREEIYNQIDDMLAVG